MPRPRCQCRIGCRFEGQYYKPRGIPMLELEEVALTLDECEALRLADVAGLYHAQAAARMGISRATFGRLLDAARRKTADAILHAKALRLPAFAPGASASSKAGAVSRPAPLTAKELP